MVEPVGKELTKVFVFPQRLKDELDHVGERRTLHLINAQVNQRAFIPRPAILEQRLRDKR